MADYHFITTWEFEAEPARVWDHVGDPGRWTDFWPGLEEVRLLGGPGDGEVGSTYEFVFKSFLPYTVSLEGRVVEVVARERMVIETEGELEGTGTFTMEEPSTGVTRTSLAWDTATTVAWMNATAPVLRGLFEWNHDFLMRKAGNGLADLLGARVVHKEATGTSLARALLPFGVIATVVWALKRIRRGAPA